MTPFYKGYFVDFLYLILSIHLIIALFYGVGLYTGSISEYDTSLLSTYARGVVHLIY